MFFAGAQGHGKDHRKAAGGFIHGFRYVAHALVKMLATRRGEEWPHESIRLGDGSLSRSLATTMLQRIDSASGPYQMVHVLGDGAVLLCEGGKAEAAYFKDMPLEYFNRRFRGLSRFFWVFGYGRQRQAYPGSVNGGTTFHAMLWHYPGRCQNSIPTAANTTGDTEIPRDADGFPQVQAKEVLSLRETLHTEWDKPLVREQVSRFIAVRVKGALAGTQLEAWRHGEEVHLRAPTVSYLTERWGRGEVDLLVKNVGKRPVALRRIRVGQPANRKGEPRPVEGLDEVATAELEALTLGPGEGRRLFTEEKERWEATSDRKKVIARMTVDCAHGVVQDWIVGAKKKKAASAEL